MYLPLDQVHYTMEAESFTLLSRDQLTEVLCHLLQQASHQQCLYSSYNFRIGTVTTAAVAGLLAWFIKSLGR